MSAELRNKESKAFDLKSELRDFLGVFKNSKLMKVGIIFNLIYIFGITIVYLYLFTSNALQRTIFSLDFSVFYLAGKLISENPLALYTDPRYILPYRYLPFYAYFFIIPSKLPFHIAYIINNILAVIANAISTFVVYLCCKSYYDADWNNDREYREDIFLFFMAPVQVVNLILGQSSPFFLLFLLSSLFFFENVNTKAYEIPKENYLGGIFLGLAILFKPIALLIVPFIIPIQFKTDTWLKFSIKFKPLYERFVGLAIPLVPNLLIFFRYPKLLRDFIESNFVHVLNFHHSTSITRFASKLAEWQGTPISETILLFNLFWLFFLIAIVKYLLKGNGNDSTTVVFYHEAIFIVLFIYPDSWFLYFVFWWAFFVPMYSKFKARQHEMGIDVISNKRNHIIFHEIPKFCMIYFSFGIILHYLLIGMDPITPILLLIFMVFYQIVSFAYLIRKKAL